MGGGEKWKQRVVKMFEMQKSATENNHMYIDRFLNIKLLVTTNQKSTLDTQTKESKHDTKGSCQNTREWKKGEKRSRKPIPRQLTKCQLEHTNQNHIECKQNKCPNQDTKWLNGYKTRYTHTHTHTHTHSLQETHFRPKTSNCLKVRWYRKMSHAN